MARGAAIILVLIAHYSLAFQPYVDVNPVLIGAGYFGVELFFALSGFLIGGIIVRSLSPRPDAANVAHFWARRWFRTLPAYYLVWIGVYHLTGSWPNAAPHLLFIQNWFAVPRDTFFGVSWSLVIEEWFYLTFPILVLALRRFANARNTILMLCIAGIVLCPLSRFLYSDLSWMDIRKSVFIRMDALMLGVLLAWVAQYRPKWMRRVASFMIPALIGLAILSCAFFDMPLLETTAGKTLYFSAVSALMLPILAALSRMRISRPIATTFGFFSVTSYSVYLVHWDVLQRFVQSGAFRHAPLISVGWLIVCAAATYFLAYLLYRLWERPWLWLRDVKFAGRRAA